MPTVVKKISDTLNEAKKQGVFRRVKYSRPSGVDNVSKATLGTVKISSIQTTYKDTNSKIVYSPATHLSGIKSDVSDYLIKRSNAEDSSAKGILNQFNNDNNMITVKNYKSDKSESQIQLICRQYEDNNLTKTKVRTLDVSDIPEIYKNIAEYRKLSLMSSKSVKSSDILKAIDKIKGSDKYLCINNLKADGSLSVTNSLHDSDHVGKDNSILGDDFPLNRIYISTLKSKRQVLKNFFTIYYSSIDVKSNYKEIVEKEVERIIPDKTRVRSVSPKAIKGKKKSASSDVDKKSSDDSSDADEKDSISGTSEQTVSTSDDDTGSVESVKTSPPRESPSKEADSDSDSDSDEVNESPRSPRSSSPVVSSSPTSKPATKKRTIGR